MANELVAAGLREYHLVRPDGLFSYLFALGTGTPLINQTVHPVGTRTIRRGRHVWKHGMYLVRLPDDQPVQWLFVDSDPLLDGCLLTVVRDVEFVDEAGANASWLDGYGGPEIVFGRSIAKPWVYRRFIQMKKHVETDLEVLRGKAIALSSWKVYTAVCRPPTA